jgi:hypothetical protein
MVGTLFAAGIAGTAFGSGTPVLTCKDLTPKSRLVVYVTLDRNDDVDYPEFYNSSGTVSLQTDLDLDGVVTLGVLKPVDANAATGRYDFEDSKGNPKPQTFSYSLKTADGSLLTIDAAGGATDKEIKGKWSLSISDKDMERLDKEAEAVGNEDGSPLTQLRVRKDAPVSCSYSWD